MPKEKRVGKVNNEGRESNSSEVRSEGKEATEVVLSERNRGHSSKSVSISILQAEESHALFYTMANRP